MSSNPEGPLHNLRDPRAEEYIGNMLEQEQGDERQRLLPPVVTQGEDTGVPIPHDPYAHQYYIQRSVDDIERSVTLREGGSRFIMSPVRRMFCGLVVFDLMLTFIMWIIYCQVNDSVNDIIQDEILCYDIHHSLFDIVMLALWRGLFLLPVYSCLCRANKWYVVLCTTSVSSVYLVVKVFKKEKLCEGQPLSYLLIISSFVVCWCELWHLDFHVVPRERAEYEKRLSSSLPGMASSADHQRRRQEFLRSQSRVAGATSAFFTPYGGSIYRARSPSEDTGSTLSNVSAELNEVAAKDHDFIRMSKDIVHMVFRMLYITDGWSIQRQEEDGICVSTKLFDGVGKVYKLECVIDVPGKVLDKLFWEDVESQPSWNPSVRESQVVRRINRKTDILHTIAAEAAGGIIAPRDFVMLRRRKKKGPLTLLCGASLDTDLVPVDNSVVRGRNGPGGWIMRDMISEPNKTEFIWLLNTELKGWIPQRLVEQSLASVMVDTARDIRKHAATLPQ